MGGGELGWLSGRWMISRRAWKDGRSRGCCENDKIGKNIRGNLKDGRGNKLICIPSVGNEEGRVEA